MTKTAFRNDFLRGLGSALIELQMCTDPARFYDAVLYGCLHNTTYDSQCEGERGWYLHQAAKLSGNEAAIEEAVCQKFFHIREDVWLFEQLTSTLYHFAVDGNETARDALYEQYEAMLRELSRKRKFQQIYSRRDMFDRLCDWLILLDGWSAFKKIVDDVSEFLLPKNIDFFFSDCFYSNSRRKFGKTRVAYYLQKQSEQLPHIRIFYEAAKEWDKKWGCNYVREYPPAPTLNEVLDAAKGEFGGRGLVMNFARKANPENLEKLAQAAMNEVDANAQVGLLWAFRRAAKYAFPEAFLSRLSQSDDELLRCLAYEFIGQNPSPETRELARALIQSGKELENGISLLAKNPLPEDEGLLYEAVKSFRPGRSKGDWHGVYMDARDGAETMRGKPKTSILEYLYRNTLCGTCRERIVRTMHKKGVLSDEILSECRFDANDDIRAFAARITRYRNRSKDKR